MKNPKTKTYNITKIRDSLKQSLPDEVVEERPLSIFLNDQKIASLMCTPKDQKYLGVGFLFSEGLLAEKDAVEKILFDSRKDQLKIFTKKRRKIPKTFLEDKTLTSGCGRRKSFSAGMNQIVHPAGSKSGQKIEDLNPLEDVLINLEFTLSADEVAKLIKEFEQKSKVFMSTGGTHSAALANREGILLFHEDIGRHNAVDKVLGESLIKKIPLQDKLIISSGRVSSDILLKAHRAEVGLIVSRSAPTSLAIELAQRFGITIVGFARGKRMNIYTYPMRVVMLSP